MLYFGLALVIFVVLLAIKFIRGDSSTGTQAAQEAVNQQRQGNRAGGGNAQVNRRAGVRNRRQVRRVDDSDSDEPQEGGGNEGGERDVTEEEALLNDPKLGAKKKAKIEAKLEKKAQREADEKLRKEKKEQEAKQEEERKKREEKEAEEEKLKLEEEIRRKQEQAQRELEEYQKLREAFTVEDEGCEVPETEEEQNLLEEFIAHIKKQKVILFEELASQFGLKVPDTIERITTLVEEGRLTGVMDDRGKFIYIPEKELKNFATFIKQRGRVSITELVENSASLINLVPETA